MSGLNGDGGGTVSVLVDFYDLVNKAVLMKMGIRCGTMRIGGLINLSGCSLIKVSRDEVSEMWGCRSRL